MVPGLQPQATGYQQPLGLRSVQQLDGCRPMDRDASNDSRVVVQTDKLVTASGTPGRPNLVVIPRADSVEYDNFVPVRNAGVSGMSNMKNYATPQVRFKRKVSTEAQPQTSKRSRGTAVVTNTSLNQDDNDEQCRDVFKCDFCTFTCIQKPQMEEHLVNSQHFSGSIYQAESCTTNSSGYKLLATHKMLAVKNRHSKAKALVVVCPECKDIFEDIFMCGMHHKYNHGSVHGFYSICPVIHHETVTVPVEPWCSKCQMRFPKQRSLHNHWMQLPDHHPVAKPTNKRVFVLYICPYCQKIFYDNFLNCKSHVLDRHVTPGAGDRGILALEIKHVLIPMRKEELPPFSNVNTQDGLEDELTILLNMKRHFREMSAQKQKLDAINKRISQLAPLCERKSHMHFL